MCGDRNIGRTHRTYKAGREGSIADRRLQAAKVFLVEPLGLGFGRLIARCTPGGGPRGGHGSLRAKLNGTRAKGRWGRYVARLPLNNLHTSEGGT